MKKLPTKREVEDAISLILSYIGEDSEREGLLETPKRVAKSYSELFSGYVTDLSSLWKTFDKSGYSGPIIKKNIAFKSMCEHHMLPIVGHVDIGYIPCGRVIGISKLSRVVNVFARRLQMQERMTVQIAEEIHKNLGTNGVAVRIIAKHFCVYMRGVNSDSSDLITTHFIGKFDTDKDIQKYFLSEVLNRGC